MMAGMYLGPSGAESWSKARGRSGRPVMALRRWAWYIALHLVTVCRDHQSLQSWHKEHVNSPSGPATRRGRWQETLAMSDLTVVYVPRMDNTVADCLSRWAHPAGKRMTGVSARCDEAEAPDSKKIIDMERMMEEHSVKCFVVIAASASLVKRVNRAVRVLGSEGAESNKQLLPETCLRDDRNNEYAKSELLSPIIGLSLTLMTGRSGQMGFTEQESKLYHNGKLLGPDSWVLELCEARHHHMMHPGVKKQALDMQRQFEVDEIGLCNAVKLLKKDCSVCQACIPDNRNVKEKRGTDANS